MALKWEKTGGPRSLDVMKSSDGRFIIWTMDDGKTFSLDDKKYNRTYGAMSKTVKGCKQRAEMILAEEAPRKSIPAMETKAMELDAYEAGRKANSEGVDYLNSPYSYRDRHLPTAAEWQRGWMDAEREKRSTKSLELRAKYGKGKR